MEFKVWSKEYKKYINLEDYNLYINQYGKIVRVYSDDDGNGYSDIAAEDVSSDYIIKIERG